MSDTDDTDVLLLIPPNFFLVHSSESEDSLLDSSRTVVHKPPTCTAHVIGKLVNQVHLLENRLESLELSTTSDTLSTLGTRRYRSLNISESCDSFVQKFSTFPRRRKRKQRKQDLSICSLNSTSTYDKHIPPLTLLQGIKHSESVVDDSPSMDGDISSIVSTPNKKNDKLLLHEIDEFLTKVETYESPETKFKPPDAELSPENVIKATGDYISQKFDTKNSADEIKLPSGRIVSSNVLDKYIYLVRNNASLNTQAEKSSLAFKSQNSGELKPDVVAKTSQETTKSSTEIRSPSIRRLNFHDTNKDVQPTSTPKKHDPGVSSSYLDSFRPSSNKIYERASKVLEQYKTQNSGNNQSSSIDTHYIISPKREEFKVPQRPYPIEMREGPKLSMYRSKFMDTIDTELLSLSDLWGEKKDGVERGESVKLEEERMKREHCEALIQDLQKKLLDHQERLAVAIKVDRSKDSAITKLKDAWLRLTSSLDKAEDRHRAALDRMMREVDNFRSVADDAQKKTNHFEAELYKALDLAHDYQEKCRQLSSEKKELQENVEKELVNKDDVISSKVKEIEVLKENYETVIRLNKQSTDCVKNIEDALQKERLDHETTSVRVIELNRKIQSMQDEKSILIQERDLLKEKVNEERARGNILERQLAEKQNQSSELLNKCDTLDYEVKSLRKHIELQKNELKTHYQKQLEEAVLSKLQEFQVQLDQAEREMENENRSKENAIVDTFNNQMVRIEEQHKLEINVLEEKHREEIKLYRLQLAQASEKISLFESKLDAYRRRRGQIASELHSVMESQWRQALQILTNGARSHASTIDLTRNDTVSTPEAHDYVAPKVPPLTIPRSSLRHEDRARSVDMFNFEGLSDTELQHYVKMLLTKPATFHEGGGGDMPQDGNTRHKELTQHNQQVTQEEPTSDRPDKDKKEKGKRSLSLSKPPWKS